MPAPVEATLESNREWALQTLCDYLRIPSVSAQGRGLPEASSFVANLLRELKFDVKVRDAGGNPVVVATRPGPGKRILFYNHYDVQPPDPLGEWKSPPFEPTIRDGKLFARGVADNKANLIARIAAVRAWGDSLPCNVTFVVEGEEEVGSRNLPKFVEKFAAELKTDLVIWESSYRDEAGRPQIILGCKGLVHGELVARGAKSDQHSSRAVIVPNPAWRLVRAMATIRDDDGRILIDGFYEDGVEPDESEEALVRKIPFEEEKLRENLGISRFVGGKTGYDLVKQFFYAPTFNICGWTGGYQGPGSKTVLPREAAVKFDIRLVPDMNPQDVIAKLRRHLDRHGFGDIEIAHVEGYPPARTPHTDPMVARVREAGEVWGCEQVVYPHMIASGPMYLFRRFGPCIGIGVGHAQSNIHAPNESVALEDFHTGARHVARLLRLLGG